jgi:electron transport complex protein RnfG
MSQIKPTIVLTLICIIVSALLVFANAITEGKIAEAEQEALNTSLVSVLGEGTNPKATSYVPTDDLIPDGAVVNGIYTDDKGQVAFEMTVDGYSTGGLYLLVGISENGEVSGVSIITISETKGLGTKVQDDSFLSQFIGATDTNYEFTKITGATFSSKGMKSAVDTALNIYNAHKEEILNG